MEDQAGTTTIQLHDYAIQVGQPWQALKRLIAAGAYSQVLALVDEHTAQYCLPLLHEHLTGQALQVILIPAGEQHKHIGTCTHIWQQMMDAGTDRRALLLNLGGGVIGDMGGFCAATFKRGLDFIQVPTTLLSQVDASVGGKLGIDFGALKNGIGVFQNPRGVFIEPAFLQTLPDRELRSGFAEVIKHALIADATQWDALKKVTNLREVDWPSFLAPSLRIKQAIVEADPHERGLRKALNFGHTIGHAVEGTALHTSNPLLHGEAIAVGMIAEAYLSFKLLGLPQSQYQAIKDYLTQLYEPQALKASDYKAYVQLMKQDKKNEGSRILFSLINPIGQAVINVEVEEPVIVEALNEVA